MLNDIIKWIIANGYRVTVVSLLSMIAIVTAGTAFPNPFNLRYAFNRIFFTPTLVCRDSTYSWSKTGQGACSSHGGIAARYP